MISNGLDPRIISAFTEFDLNKHCILAAYVGSISHNTYVPPEDPNAIDDVDIMGIVVPPPEYIIGLHEFDHWTMQKDELDVVIYDYRKFIRLLLKQNPNVVGLLWLRPEHYIVRDPAAEILLAKRDIFSSKKAYSTFAGYANSQLHRMTHMAFEGYMGQKRKALVEKFGYDTKNAAHLLRLLTMCIEFLETGVMKVYRDEDAEIYRSVKRGEWPLEKVKAESDRLFERARRAYENSSLPETPDVGEAEAIAMRMALLRINGIS